MLPVVRLVPVDMVNHCQWQVFQSPLIILTWRFGAPGQSKQASIVTESNLQLDLFAVCLVLYVGYAVPADVDIREGRRLEKTGRDVTSSRNGGSVQLGQCVSLPHFASIDSKKLGHRRRTRPLKVSLMGISFLLHRKLGLRLCSLSLFISSPSRAQGTEIRMILPMWGSLYSRGGSMARVLSSQAVAGMMHLQVSMASMRNVYILCF